MKPWILLSAALIGVSLAPAETALAKGYDAYSPLESARVVMGGYKAPAPRMRQGDRIIYPREDTESIKNFRIHVQESGWMCCTDGNIKTVTSYDKFGGIHEKDMKLTAKEQREENGRLAREIAYMKTPEYQLEQLRREAEENQKKLEEMIKNSKFREDGEVNGKPAYYNPVTRQRLTADSNGKYELHDW